MSVRNSLLAILTLGPAYGFQLHGELRTRTGGRRTINVGQIYGTLERLVTHGAVEPAGLTDDSLPLYRLTPTGRDEAFAWLQSTESSSGEEWPDLVDRVLIASSLPDVDVVGIIAASRTRWEDRRASAVHASTPPTSDAAAPGGQESLGAAASLALAEAALSWLSAVDAALRAAEPGAFHRPLSNERPRRGRRPARDASIDEA